MKHLLYIILLSLLFFSACKSQAEQKQQEANDTIVVETPKIIQDAPLVAGSVTLKDGDFGELIELAATHQILDEEGPIFKMSEPEMLIKDGYFLLQNRPAMSYTRRPDGTVEVVKLADEGLNCFFHWYRLPDFRYITSFGIGGNGPNEFNFPHLVSSGVSAPGTYVYETGTMQLFETDTTGVLRAFPFTFKSSFSTTSISFPEIPVNASIASKAWATSLPIITWNCPPLSTTLITPSILTTSSFEAFP